ncbi:hypothetical protein F5Y17DRAFT_432288 [Xylariaceae sp. FL0594]|nr:hypothetical protein F5Y17DRAFT_432288 [Xylariaceae sp. FL0594]
MCLPTLLLCMWLIMNRRWSKFYHWPRPCRGTCFSKGTKGITPELPIVNGGWSKTAGRTYHETRVALPRRLTTALYQIYSAQRHGFWRVVAIDAKVS